MPPPQRRCPEENAFKGNDRYRFRRFGVYKIDPVQARNSKLTRILLLTLLYLSSKVVIVMPFAGSPGLGGAESVLGSGKQVPSRVSEA